MIQKTARNPVNRTASENQRPEMMVIAIGASLLLWAALLHWMIF